MAAQKEAKPACSSACCEKSKAEVKKSTRKCCVAAERAGKVCTKCNPAEQNTAKKK